MASEEENSGQGSLNDTSYIQVEGNSENAGANSGTSGSGNSQQNQTGGSPGRIVCGPNFSNVNGGRLSGNGSGNVPNLSTNPQMNFVRRLDFDNAGNVNAGNLDSSRRISQEQQQQQQQSMVSGMYESSNGTFPDSGRGGSLGNQNRPGIDNSVVSGGCNNNSNNNQSSSARASSGSGNSGLFQQQTPTRSYNIDSYSIPLQSTPDPRPPEQRSGFQNRNLNLNQSPQVPLTPIQPPSYNMGRTFESGASLSQFASPRNSQGQRSQRLSQGQNPNQMSFVGQNFIGQAAMDVPPDELAVVNENMRKIMARVAFNVVNNRMHGLWDDLMAGMNNHFMDFLIANLVPIIESLMMSGEWPWSFCQCCAGRNRQQNQVQNINMRGRGPSTAGQQVGNVQLGNCQRPCSPGQNQQSSGGPGACNNNNRNNQTNTSNPPPPTMTSSQNSSPRNSTLNSNSNPSQSQQPLPFASNSFYDNINPCPRLDGSSNCGCPMGKENTN